MLEITYDEKYNLKLNLYPSDLETPPLFIYIHGGGLEGGNRHCSFAMFEQLAKEGMTIASLDYRMYPTAKFPDFIEDCAKAIAFLKNYQKFSKIVVGGSSAGAYISMMLLLDGRYLAKYTDSDGEAIDPLKIEGWLLDAGQPTTHFNVLRERGLDTRLVRIDEAAPLYYINKDFKPTRPDGKLPKILTLAASNDMTCRLEQLKLFDATMRHFGYPKDRLRFEYMNGFGHCGYDGNKIFAKLIKSFVADC